MYIYHARGVGELMSIAPAIVLLNQSLQYKVVGNKVFLLNSHHYNLQCMSNTLQVYNSNILKNKFPDSDMCNKVLCMIPKLEFKESELSLITQSRQALAADIANYESERTADMINGDVATNSEVDDPENFIGIKDPTSSSAVTIIANQRAINKR